MRGATDGARSFAGKGGAAVEAVGLVRRHRRGVTVVEALRGVSLTIGEGELVAVTGPSGSGKSTLLHVLGGLDVPDEGRVVIAGHTLGALSDDALTVFRRRRIGVVFQAYNLLPALSAEENVALPLLLDGVSRRAIDARVADALRAVGMLARRSHRPAELSGGEQQRIAVARALVVESALILADEPTGSLDSRTAADVLDLLREAARDRGRTILMVTHDRDAAAVADRELRMVDGALTAAHGHDLSHANGTATWTPGAR
jgi:putative ABC transport system ATP-binding protein